MSLHQDIPEGFCQCGCGQKTAIAKQTWAERGHVKGKPLRFVFTHQRRKSAEQFAVESRGYETPCWIWLWYKTPKGYGRIVCDGKTQQAHRAFYERYVGAIPDGLQLDHLCRNRACVNPDHLEPVTNAENSRRARMAA